jgi:hypothetical protein
MIRPLLAATALLVVACTTTAYTLPPEDRAAIATRVAGFEWAFVNNDTTEIVNVVPPRIISTIAEDSGVPEALLRSEMAKLTREATRDVKVLSFGMSLDNAEFLTTPSGRPYGLIPTQTVVQMQDGQKLQSDTHTLTLEDGGAWHLIRIDEPRQIEIMREVYPDFENVTFPQGSAKVVR